MNFYETLSQISPELFGSSFIFSKYNNANKHVHLDVDWGREKHVKARSDFTLRETKLILKHHQCYNLYKKNNHLSFYDVLCSTTALPSALPIFHYSFSYWSLPVLCFYSVQVAVTLFLALVVGAIFFDVQLDGSGQQNRCLFYFYSGANKTILTTFFLISLHTVS